MKLVNKMSINEKIQEIRENKKITRKQMADYLCTSAENYKKIEYGMVRLTLENFLIICNVLQISPMELINESTEEHFILLNNKDITDLERILNKIQKQMQNINIKDNHGTINITQNKK